MIASAVLPSRGSKAAAAAVELRPFPYPYSAALAICSDLDETPDRDVYWETARFLNTTQTTVMGPGVGLEVGNSIYFDMPPAQFAYWNTDDAGRAMVRDLIRSGHIDCLHSYGDLATTRAHAGRALDELARHDCQLSVWVDHSKAVINFGGDIMRGMGDVPGNAAYHADLTCGYGIEFVARGRVTSVIGQGAAPSLRGVFRAAHPIASARTVAKEAAKQLLSRCGHAKYAMHSSNAIQRPARLRDGRSVREMLRCNPHWRGLEHGDTAAGLGEVLTDRFLERLVRRRGACVLYTHLGKIRDRREIFPEATRHALRRLAEYARAGKILVTTTRRLLGLCSMVDAATASARYDDGTVSIDVRTLPAKFDYDGITCYVPDSPAYRMTVNGEEAGDLRPNGPDETGRRSVSVAWTPLTFPSR